MGSSAMALWRHIITRGVMALMLAACLSATASANVVLIVGDSISAAYGMDTDQGWVAKLQRQLDDDCRGVSVINASVSGETTAGGRSRLPGLLQRHAPQVVVIELGGNDGLRGLPPANMAANLRAMIDMSKQADAQPVLLGMRIPPNYGERYTAMFEQQFHDVAADTALPFFPFFLDGVVEAGQLQADGIHPTASAQRRLLNNAWSVLAPVVEPLCDTPADGGNR